MRLFSRMMILVTVAIAMVFMGTGLCSAKIIPGKPAPLFSLKDVKGRTYNLSAMKYKSLVVIYFFDVDSLASIKGLLPLDGLAKQYKDADLNVWGITRSSKSKVEDFIAQTGIMFPILLDNTNVSDLYDARRILPTACILGPKLKILDHTKGPHRHLVKLAERKLQQGNPEIAGDIGTEVLKDDPQNEEAKKVKGDSNLGKGNLKEAEKMAKELIAKGGSAEIAGKEILANVYMRQGKTDEALKIIKEVIKKAPNRSWPHILKGDILYSQGKKKEAEAEYRAAIKATAAKPNYKADARSRIGKIKLQDGETVSARKQFAAAEEISPHVIEHTTNKGVAYEREGKLDEAWKAYREAQAFDKNDVFAAVLAKRAQETIDLQKNAERRNQRNQRIKELAERFRTMKDEEVDRPEPEDTWITSKLTVLTFLDFQEIGGMPVREGFSTVLTYRLAKLLNDSGRVEVVDRDLMEQLLQALNLGSSDLADPKTRRKLGRLFDAKVIGTGKILHSPGSTLLGLRLIDVVDVETSKICEVKKRPIGSGTSMQKELHRLNREILTSIIKNYPLQAYIFEVDGAYVKINIGPDKGVVLGTMFNVIEEKESTVYRGKTYDEDSRSVANIEVIELKRNFCKGKIIDQKRPVKIDDKVKEAIEFHEM